MPSYSRVIEIVIFLNGEDTGGHCKSFTRYVHSGES
jgi:hypothetical protein